jgi:hypothetical protein
MWAISVIFKVTTQSYQSSSGGKFAQSGHPAWYNNPLADINGAHFVEHDIFRM